MTLVIGGAGQGKLEYVLSQTRSPMTPRRQKPLWLVWRPGCGERESPCLFWSVYWRIAPMW